MALGSGQAHWSRSPVGGEVTSLPRPVQLRGRGERGSGVAWVCGGGRGGGVRGESPDRETGRPVGAVALAAPYMERRMRGSEAAMATEAVMRWRGAGQYRIHEIKANSKITKTVHSSIHSS